MSGKKIPTSSLLERLFKTSSISRFINRYNAKSTGAVEFHKYIEALCAEKNILPKAAIKKADIERNYGQQLFKGIRKPSRDKVIQLAFGLELNYEETQKLLTVARKSILYPKIERDAVIIYALKHDYKIQSVQSTLFELSIPLLGDER
jgi:hypothetical protein